MDLILEAKTHKLSSIKSYPLDDCEKIWEAISTHIRDSLLDEIGIKINKLGIFTLKRIELFVGRKDVVFVKPQFILEERMALDNGIKYGRPFTYAKQKVMPVNFTQLAKDTKLPREWTENVLKEVVDTFWRMFKNKKKANLIITNVGTINLKNQTILGVFNTALTDQIDMGVNKSKNEAMNYAGNRHKDERSIKSVRISENLNRTWPEPPQPSQEPIDAHKTIKVVPAEDPPQPVQIPLDDTIAEPVIEEPIVSHTPPLITAAEAARSEVAPEPQVFIDTGHITRPIMRKENTFIPTEYRSTPTDQPKVAEYRRIATAQRAAQAACGARGECQRELCYICSQRAARNVPVYVRKQEEEAERKNAQILQMAQQRKAEEAMQKEFELRQEQRRQNREVAAFNQGAAVAVKEKRLDEAKSHLPHGSNVFKDRPLTPHKSVAFKKVKTDLSHQMETRKTSKAKADADKRLIERLYQIQLAEDLAQERETYLKEKEHSKQKLKQTYEYQMRTRLSELPASYGDVEVFGKNDVNAEKRQKIRQRNKLYASDQFLTFNRNKSARDKVYKEKVRQETEMLRRTKTDLDMDTNKRSHYKKTMRKSLESNWLRAADEKYEREVEAKIGIPERITVQEQLDHYRKCTQCTRRPQNHGQSNIWRETYYTPGSRLIV